ncbi:unnamed protein product [Rotaria socialis]|uniref:Uncharacterized protein n=4 Tax=Rotaria socialis TaxID=392032 RepID=A0A821SDE4_9BILA|nr:unnamed protein product [Rotaria socialis]
MLMNKNQSTLENFPVSSSTLGTSPFCSTTLAVANAKSNKATEKQKTAFVTSLSDWVCSNARPINIVEDRYTYGPVSASSILPRRKTVKKEIKNDAKIGRNEMKAILIGVAYERQLSLSPDLWSDSYKKMCYLGCTAQWVDKDWKLCSFELFCLPY